MQKLAAVLAVMVACVLGRPPYSGTIFPFPNAFQDSDPTTLAGVTYVGREQKSVFDRRSGRTSINAYVYSAAFDDGVESMSIMVNPEFDQAEAGELAEKYARSIGQMPHCIRSGLSGAVIHDGGNLWGGGDPLTIHHGQGLNYERQGIVTETMIHEATHAGFDRRYYTPDWSAAVEADSEFVSTYARDYPDREDHAESFLCWVVARYKKDRISAADYAKITTAIPIRLEWYDGQNFNLSPVVAVTTLARNGRAGRYAAKSLFRSRYRPVLSGATVGYPVDRSSRISPQIIDLNGRIIRELAPHKLAR